MRIEFKQQPQQDEIADQGLKVNYGAGKRVAYRLRWYFILALIASPVITLVFFFMRDHLLIEAPAVITVEPTEIRAPSTATVAYTTVSIGQPVRSGELLVMLNNRELVEDILFMQQEMKTLSVSLQNEEQKLLDQHQAKVNEAKSALDEQLALAKLYEGYEKRGALPLADRVAITRGRSDAVLRLHETEIQLQEVKHQQSIARLSGPLAATRRDIDRQLKQRSTQLDELSVQAPFDARLIDILVRPGERVEENQLLLLLSNNKKPLVVAYLDPKYIDKTELGMEASVIMPNGKKMKARVARPTQLATKLPPQLTRPFEGSPAMLRVTLEFTEQLDGSKWVEGMPVTVRF